MSGTASCLGAVALLTAMAIAAPQSAAATDTTTQVRLASSREVLLLAEAALRRGDEATAERALRALFSDPEGEVRAEARFRVAKLLANRGRTSDAAVLLRQIVDEYPNAAPVRLELAGLLQKLGYEELAFRQLLALRTMNLPGSVAHFVDRLAASLQAAKPFGLYAELALAPDSNINRATTSRTLGTVFGDFLVDEDSKARSGIGVAIRGAAHARHRLGSDASLVARATVDMTIYRRKSFNYISAELAAGPDFDLGSRRISLVAGAGRSWYGMEPFSHYKRVAAEVTQRLGSVSQARVEAGVRWNSNEWNKLQDGRGSSLRLVYERALSPRLFIAGSAGVDRFKARDDGYSTRSISLGASAQRDLGRMTLSLAADVGWLQADEPLMLFPEARNDSFARLQVGGVFRNFTVGGFAPVSRLVIERNRSSIAFYDYTRTRTEFGVAKAF